ncbi:MAG TPA: hypothetical protein VMM78_00520 [Thermomicrobiales bacterium]|nr:hypothetical protein [Thermomicrobiales bacterium]
MNSTSRKLSADEARAPIGDIAFADVLSGVGDEVAGLVKRLPEGVDLIERNIADGADPEGLALMLGSLPDADEVERLRAALDNPAELDRLLATRDAITVSQAWRRDRKRD